MTKSNRLKAYFFFPVLLAFFLANSALASIDVYEFKDERKRGDFVALTKELRCPKCQNQDIADSNAPIAADMRKEVHRLLEEGYDRERIVDHMIERFGDFVTYKPKVSGETYVLWYGPWVAVLLGLIIIFSMIKFKRPAKDDNPKTLAENDRTEELKKILEKYNDQDETKT